MSKENPKILQITTVRILNYISFLIEVLLIYYVVLIPAVQQSDPVIHV